MLPAAGWCDGQERVHAGKITHVELFIFHRMQTQP